MFYWQLVPIFHRIGVNKVGDMMVIFINSYQPSCYLLLTFFGGYHESLIHQRKPFKRKDARFFFRWLGDQIWAHIWRHNRRCFGACRSRILPSSKQSPLHGRPWTHPWLCFSRKYEQHEQNLGIDVMGVCITILLIIISTSFGSHRQFLERSSAEKGEWGRAVVVKWQRYVKKKREWNKWLIIRQETFKKIPVNLRESELASNLWEVFAAKVVGGEKPEPMSFPLRIKPTGDVSVHPHVSRPGHFYLTLNHGEHGLVEIKERVNVNVSAVQGTSTSRSITVITALWRKKMVMIKMNQNLIQVLGLTRISCSWHTQKKA